MIPDGARLFLAQLVNCGPLEGQTPCETSDLRGLAFTIYERVLIIGALLTVLFFIIGAVLLVISTGDPNRIALGKRAMTSAVVGFIIMLSAWLVINTFLTVFTNCDPSAVWTSFQCN